MKLIYYLLRFLVKICFFCGETLSRIYEQIIWPCLNLTWYDNDLNLLGFWNKPHSLERVILMNMYMKSGGRALDIGCGDGFGCAVISTKASCTIGIDADEEALKVANGRNYRNGKVEFKKVDLIFIENLDLNDKFDLISCFSVIQFLKPENVRMVVAFAIKKLNTCGYFIGSTTSSNELDPNFISGRHKSFYENEAALKGLLQGFFSEVSITTSDWGAGRKELYFFCRKSIFRDEFNQII